MYELLPELTKDYILTKVSQEEIFCFYLRISEVTPNVSIKSPLRIDDDSPSFEFRYNNNHKLRGIDYNGKFNGDCFDCIGYLHGLNSRNKQDFIKILHIIARDFRLHKYKNSTYKRELLYKEEFNITKKPKTIFKVKLRKLWTRNDKLWWDINLTKETLQKGDVYPIDLLWVNNDTIPMYSYSIYDPCYGYYIGRNQEGIDEWKFYFPYRPKHKKRPRFISNSSSIQGIRNIKKAKVGIITKSYKDVLTFKKFEIDGQEIQAVAPASENIILTESEINYLYKFWDYIIVNYDYDPTGLHSMWLYRYIYNIKPLFFVNETWNSKIDYPIKDFYDYVKHTNNDTRIQEEINEYYNNLNLW
jgi:hypothetical protein